MLAAGSPFHLTVLPAAANAGACSAAFGVGLPAPELAPGGGGGGGGGMAAAAAGVAKAPAVHTFGVAARDAFDNALDPTDSSAVFAVRMTGQALVGTHGNPAVGATAGDHGAGGEGAAVGGKPFAVVAVAAGGGGAGGGAGGAGVGSAGARVPAPALGEAGAPTKVATVSYR